MKKSYAQTSYTPHLKKYTDIDKDILQMENIKKNLIMKDRKLNAEGGRIGYSGGGKAGLPAITYGNAPNEYATTSNACRPSTRRYTWGNDSGSESNATELPGWDPKCNREWVECLNVECLNVECLNVECLNVECLNLEGQDPWLMQAEELVMQQEE